MTSSLISAKDLCCERDDRYLFQNLSFDLQSGELVRVVGPNGAGKSTLLRMLVGLFTCYDGDLHVDIDTAKIEYLGHKLPVKRNLSALENLEYHASFKGGVDESKHVTVLETLGMKGYEHVLCNDMSEGQRRRVALAQVLSTPSHAIILDEPFASLDVDGVAYLESHLQALAESGRLVVFTTHHIPKISGVRELSLVGGCSDE